VKSGHFHHLKDCPAPSCKNESRSRVPLDLNQDLPFISDKEEINTACGPCFTQVKRGVDKGVGRGSNLKRTQEPLPPPPPGVFLENFTRASNSGSSCLVCGKEVDRSCCSVPYYARMELLLDFNILIGPNKNCRICKAHLQGEHLKEDLVIERKFPSQDAFISWEEAGEFFKDLVEGMRSFRKRAALNFDDGSMTDDDYQLWTGWTRQEFLSFLPYLKGMRESSNRSLESALGIFWVKTKTNLSFSQVASLLGLRDPRNDGRIIVSKTFIAVTERLQKNFVPLYLGTNHLSPQESKTHSTVYSKSIFGDEPTTIWDGTYIYIDKSSNYEMSRKSFSGHKHRPLLKFMSICFPDGYVLDTIGPFFSNGKNNDPGMTTKIMEDNLGGIKTWVTSTPNQIAIVDRGFQRVLEDLEGKGLQVHMPACAAKGKDNGKGKGKTNSQISVEEANRSRLVTKIRFITFHQLLLLLSDHSS